MATPYTFSECRSKTWHGRCSIFSSNGCKNQCKHWEYATFRACHGSFNRACYCYYNREQKIHC
ncbi:hypothetical protein FCV25MIE_01231 [Fagus crenata]